MHISLPVLTAALACSVAAAPGKRHQPSRCRTTSNYPGWAKIKNAFIFGDSYTQTGFNLSLTQPAPGNPLGNPSYPGWTSSNGPNWVDFLTVKYNASALLTYNLAYGGATVSASLVTPYAPQVLSLSDQVEKLFVPTYAFSPAWSGADTLVGIFMGINDVGNSWWLGDAAAALLNNKIFAIYDGLVEELYNSGARNFVFLDVPPVDRSPLMMAQGAQAPPLVDKAVKAFNVRVKGLAQGLKGQHPEVNVFFVSAWEAFTEVLDKPSSYPATALYKNTTAYCAAYQNGTPEWDTFEPACGLPVNEYFWLNSLHPTYPVHNVLAENVASQLKSGPNIC